MKQLLIVGGVMLAFVAILLGGLVWNNSSTPLSWRTCQSGAGFGSGSVCLRDVSDLGEIRRTPDGCLTDGNNVICGSYWQRQDKW